MVYLFLYESSDLSLEAVHLMYTDPACTPRNSARWAPPGFANRRDLVEQVRAGEAGKPSVKGGAGEIGGGTLGAEEERKEFV